MAINITDPSYISEYMLDKVVKEKFHDNADDTAVRNQANQILADIPRQQGTRPDHR